MDAIPFPMLQRVLAREDVDERTRTLLDASGISSYRQLAQRPLWDAARAADLSVDETSVRVPLSRAPPFAVAPHISRI
jgi:hypothetical protein